jgi:hypothetical protein
MVCNSHFLTCCILDFFLSISIHPTLTLSFVLQIYVHFIFRKCFWSAGTLKLSAILIYFSHWKFCDYFFNKFSTYKLFSKFVNISISILNSSQHKIPINHHLRSKFWSSHFPFSKISAFLQFSSPLMSPHIVSIVQ